MCTLHALTLRRGTSRQIVVPPRAGLESPGVHALRRYDALTLYSGTDAAPEAVLAQYHGEMRPYDEVLPTLLSNHSARVEFQGTGVGGHSGFDVTFRICTPAAQPLLSQYRDDGW